MTLFGDIFKTSNLENCLPVDREILTEHTHHVKAEDRLTV